MADHPEIHGVSVVIPARNAGATLGRCLAACLAQSHTAHEVIVVDDGATDDTAGIAGGFPVTCISQENAGPAAARNRGAREASGDIVAFTDADCIPASDWLARLAQGFRPGVAAVGGTYDIANPERLLPRLIHQEILERHRRLRGEVDFLGSFNVAYRKEAFDAAGGFDEDFRTASGEDNDLAYRLADAGGRLVFAPEARVAHMHPDRLGRYLRTQLRHGFWRMKLYAKHPRRARGDRYAGPGDLLGAPLALLLAVAAVALLFSLAAARHTLPLGGLTLALLAVYAAMRAPMATRMARATRDWRMLAHGDLAFVRDLARGLGMAAGAAWFVMLRRKTA